MAEAASSLAAKIKAAVAKKADVAEAAAALAAKIKATIAKKPDVAKELIRDVIRGLKGKQADDLNDAGIHTVADLAGANVDNADYNKRSLGGSAPYARAKLWEFKGQAAKRFDVDIGALPRAPYGFLCGRVSVTVIDTNPAPAVDVAP